MAKVLLHSKEKEITTINILKKPRKEISRIFNSKVYKWGTVGRLVIVENSGTWYNCYPCVISIFRG